MSHFYVVATPIGNLEDITLRALRILKEVDIVLCEDTRTTQKIFEKYDIRTPTMSYHAHSGETKVEQVLNLLREGKNLALVSDAGTPGISDPGSLLVSQIREQFSGDEVKIESVPGPSALTAALSIAGVPIADFVFIGFLPHKKGRETLFKEIAISDRTMVMYESTHRLEKTLESLVEHLSSLPQQKTVVVVKELTKMFEEVVRGDAVAVQKYFTDHKDKVRGEFVIIVS